MKKQIFAVTILTAALCLTACSGNSSSAGSSSAPAETTTSAAETTTSAAETTTSAAETTTTASGTTTTASAKDKTDLKLLVGTWIYQSREQTLSDDWNPILLGTIDITKENTYTYTPADGSAQKTGTIKLGHEEYSNGDTVPFFSFMNDDGEFFMSAYCQQNETDVYYLGNGGEERIVRKGSAADTAADAEAPNSYGYITAKNLPANGLSAGILNGKWQNTQDDSESLTFTDCDQYTGKFTLQNHAEYVEGTVVLEYNYAPDNTTKVFWFNLYRANGELMKTLAVPDGIPADTLYPQTQDTGYYVRENA